MVKYGRALLSCCPRKECYFGRVSSSKQYRSFPEFQVHQMKNWERAGGTILVVPGYIDKKGQQYHCGRTQGPAVGRLQEKDRAFELGFLRGEPLHCCKVQTWDWPRGPFPQNEKCSAVQTCAFGVPNIWVLHDQTTDLWSNRRPLSVRSDSWKRPSINANGKTWRARPPAAIRMAAISSSRTGDIQAV